MKRLKGFAFLAVLALLAFGGLASVQAQTTTPATSTAAAPGGILGLFIKDFTAAQARYAAAAAAQPAGSALAGTFTADAACLGTAIAQFNAASSALAAPPKPVGIVDLGAELDIQLAVAQAAIASASSSAVTSSTACDALVGSLVRKSVTGVNQLLNPANVIKALGAL